MPDDLERQLSAFGRTLEARAGEPIRRDAPSTEQRARRRWWAIAGAAACVVAAVAGLAFVVRGREDAPRSSSPPPSGGPDLRHGPDPVPTARIPDLPADPLGLIADGWVLTERRLVDQWTVADTTSCGEWIEVFGLGGLAVAVDTYELSGGAGVSVTVTYADLGDPSSVAARLAPMADPAAACAALDLQLAVPAVTALGVGDGLGFDAGGWRVLTVTDGDDRFIWLDAFGGDTALLDDLVGRIDSFLAEPGATVEAADLEALTTGSIEVLFPECPVGDLIRSTFDPPAGDETTLDPDAPTLQDAFRRAHDVIVSHAEAEQREPLPSEGWSQVSIRDLVVFRYEDDAGLRAVLRVRSAGNGYAPTEVAECVPPGGSSFIVEVGAPAGEQQPVIGPTEEVLTLWVSNQSFDDDDPVHVTVEIDGRTVVDDDFEVGSQHNWFSFLIRGLTPGAHAIRATSDTGASWAGAVTMTAGAPRWAVLDYWYYPDDDLGRYFSFTESDEPVPFD